MSNGDAVSRPEDVTDLAELKAALNYLKARRSLSTLERASKELAHQRGVPEEEFYLSRTTLSDLFNPGKGAPTERTIEKYLDLLNHLGVLTKEQQSHWKAAWKRTQSPIGLTTDTSERFAATELFVQQRPLPDHPPPSMLLRPDYEIVPFHGRNPEMEDLLRWTASVNATSIHLITGPAGQGKTRLAQYLCSTLQEHGWKAGIVADHASSEALNKASQLIGPVLLAFDYAESRKREIGAFLGAVASQPDDPRRRVRILLIARSRGEWERDLKVNRDDRVAGLFAMAGHHRLGALNNATTDRYAEFTRALNAFAPHVEPVVIDSVPPVNVDRSHYDRVLDVHAASLAQLLDSVHTDPSDPLRDPVARVLHHEYRYWSSTARAFELPNPHPARLDAVTATATLFGDTPDHNAVDLLAALPTFRGETRDILDQYLRWHQGLYPDARQLSPLRPDRLGEDHVALVLATQPGVAIAASETATDDQLRQALTILGRVSARHAHLSDIIIEVLRVDPRRIVPLGIEVAISLDDPRPISRGLTAVLTELDSGSLDEVSEQIPAQTLALAEFAVDVSQTLLRYQQQGSDADPETLVGRLNELSLRLGDSGRYDDALSIMERLTRTRRAQVQHDGDAHLPDLADALNALSVRLAGVGRREEALSAINEATETYRRLADRDSDTYTPSLAWALSNLSLRLSELGNDTEALTAAEEAAKIRRELAANDPDVYVPGLATALNNFSIHLGNLGRVEEAMVAITEAENLYRDLVDHNPDAYAADFAGTLNNLSIRLAELGRDDEALAAIEESVAVYRRLAEHQPDSYLTDMAAALNNASLRLAELDRKEEALAAIEEAVRIRRALVVNQPDANLPHLATALYNFAQLLDELDRLSDALAAVDEVIQARRLLANRYPDAHLKELAAALECRSTILTKMDRNEEAWATGQEAVHLYRNLASRDVETYHPGLASSLYNLCLSLRSLVRTREALTVVEEAVEIYRSLANHDPAQYLPEFATASNMRSILLADLDRDEDALIAANEGIRALRGPAGRSRSYLPTLAIALYNCSLLLSSLKQNKQALTAIEEAVELNRILVADDPDTYLTELADALDILAEHLTALGRDAEASAIRTERAQIGPSGDEQAQLIPCSSGDFDEALIADQDSGDGGETR